jgi:SSS family solute:Na+ symporter
MGHFSWFVDGPIVGLYLLATMAAGIAVRKYVGKVEHFLMAGREINIYLGIASLAATEFGIVTCMYTAELGYKHGFAGATPGICMAGAMLLVGLTGFCVKPLRDSGVMTIPELLERKFGPRIRWASGVVIVLGGLLNMGVFLRMGGDFLVYSTGLDPKYLVITMTVLLVAVAVYTILGGMLSVLVTDYLQFVVMSVGLIAVTVLIFVNVGWDTIVTKVTRYEGAGGFNPFVNPDLGWQFVLFQSLHNLAAVLTWQTTIQRLLAAKDTATGRKIYTRTSFFFVCRFLIPGIWGMAAFAVLTPAAFAVLPADMADKHTLLAMPIFLGSFVNTGLMGILIAAMLAADMSTDSSYMLTWGSVIYNDILAPFRKGRVSSEKRGILWNRAIVAAIGIYLLLFGLWFPIKGDIWNYLSVTGTIYLSSMSILLVAACYWKRANSWGAAGAIAFGALIPMTHLVLSLIPSTAHIAKDGIGDNVTGLSTYLMAGGAMVVGSLLKPRRPTIPAQEVNIHG